MHRFLSISITVALLLGAAACAPAGESGQPGTPAVSSSGESERSSSLPGPPPPGEHMESQREQPLFEDRSDLQFSDLSGFEFVFSSGVGAWGTTVKIAPDGSFTGVYVDSDAGDSAEDFPYGTRYECCFSGTFSALVKTGPYEYAVTCESLATEGIAGEEAVVRGVRVVQTEPYGFDGAGEFRLYLPGIHRDALPPGFLSWVYLGPDDQMKSYGLYNVAGEQGFRAYPA